jgi:hypothetical protein
MKSKSHHDPYTGILDMNGIPIMKNCTVRIHDAGWSRREQIGKVKWKQGSYVLKGKDVSEYNIFAWRKKVEVIEPKSLSKYDDNEFEELYYKFEQREFKIMTPHEHRQIFRKAFRLGWESKIEQEHFNEHK